jgi:hypothetical protein
MKNAEPGGGRVCHLRGVLPSPRLWQGRQVSGGEQTSKFQYPPFRRRKAMARQAGETPGTNLQTGARKVALSGFWLFCKLLVIKSHPGISGYIRVKKFDGPVVVGSSDVFKGSKGTAVDSPQSTVEGMGTEVVS